MHAEPAALDVVSPDFASTLRCMRTFLSKLRVQLSELSSLVGLFVVVIYITTLTLISLDFFCDHLHQRPTRGAPHQEDLCE